MGSNGAGSGTYNTHWKRRQIIPSTPQAVLAGNTTGMGGTSQLNSNSRGVVGLNNLSMSATAGGNTQGSVITSTGKNVHLDSGTRLLLVAQASAAATSN